MKEKKMKNKEDYQKKEMSYVEYCNIPKLPGYDVNNSTDYNKYKNNRSWKILERKLDFAKRKGLTHTPSYEKNYKKFIKLCEENNLPMNIT